MASFPDVFFALEDTEAHQYVVLNDPDHCLCVLLSAKVRLCRHRFFHTRDLGYRGIRGAVGLGCRFHCIRYPNC
jgi:hypothetical protein